MYILPLTKEIQIIIMALSLSQNDALTRSQKSLSRWSTESIQLTCSRPPVSPTTLRWFFMKSAGVWEDSLANMIMANRGTLLPQLLAPCSCSADASMCSLTASQSCRSSRGLVLSSFSSVVSRSLHPTRLSPFKKTESLLPRPGRNKI